MVSKVTAYPHNRSKITHCLFLFILLLSKITTIQAAPFNNNNITLGITFAPFIEVLYIPDMGGPAENIEMLNETLGGWLVDYKEIEIFKYMPLLGIEIRSDPITRYKNIEIFASIAGIMGSQEYNEKNDLRGPPIIPGVIDYIASLPYTEVSGKINTKVVRHVDYHIPLLFGIRKEFFLPEKSLISFFVGASMGYVFFKTKTEIDAEINGTSLTKIPGLTQAQTLSTHATFKGYSGFQDNGFITNTLAGIKFSWSNHVFSSFALGYRNCELQNDIEIRGVLSGSAELNTSIDEYRYDITPSIQINQSMDTKMQLTGYRIKFTLLSMAW